MNPDSTTRILWDLGSLVMVLYDMVMIPMQAAEKPWMDLMGSCEAYSMPESLFLDFMASRIKGLRIGFGEHIGKKVEEGAGMMHSLTLLI